MATDDNLHEFLNVADWSTVREPEYEADEAQAEEIPEELRQKVLVSAQTSSLDFLAKLVREAAESTGWSPDELAYEAIGHESDAAVFLLGRGDPRNVSASGLARLFKALGLEPSDWSRLLSQSVAGIVTFPSTGGHILGRTSRLNQEERARALGSPETRDPSRAKKVADQFVEEVIDEWMILTG
jgi:hypothetical protein